jgi:hypothetical protein
VPARPSVKLIWKQGKALGIEEGKVTGSGLLGGESLCKDWPVFVTETVCVYCAVQTGYLYKIQVNLDLQKINVKVMNLFHTPSPPSKVLQRHDKQHHSYKTRRCAIDLT